MDNILSEKIFSIVSDKVINYVGNDYDMYFKSIKQDLFDRVRNLVSRNSMVN